MYIPKVSIIVLNYNGRALLEQFLPSVANQDYPNYEVIVVDNASTDGSVEFVKSTYPRFRVIRNRENIGISAGYNVATVIAEGK